MESEASAIEWANKYILAEEDIDPADTQAHIEIKLDMDERTDAFGMSKSNARSLYNKEWIQERQLYIWNRKQDIDTTLSSTLTLRDSIN